MLYDFSQVLRSYAKLLLSSMCVWTFHLAEPSATVQYNVVIDCIHESHHLTDI